MLHNFDMKLIFYFFFCIARVWSQVSIKKLNLHFEMFKKQLEKKIRKINPESSKIWENKPPNLVNFKVNTMSEDLTCGGFGCFPKLETVIIP